MAQHTNEMVASAVIGYLGTAQFTDCGPDAEDGIADAEWSEDARTQAAAKCAAFLSKVTDADLEAYQDRVELHQDWSFDPMAHLGSDLWYTSNGHGVGFWDRSELDADGLGDRLSDLARYDTADVYLSDAGELELA